MNWTELVNNFNFNLLLLAIFVVLFIIANQLIEKNKLARKGRRAHA
jgi:hypothetical protein